MSYAPNSSVFHNVPAIRQPQSWACWYTSFQMVVAYERGRGNRTLKDPSEVPWVKAIYDANQGIGSTDDERERVAWALGFEALFASLSAEGVWQIMRNVPIIYAGRWPGKNFGHWVVLVGISETKLAINNPASGMELYDYNWFASEMLQQTAERPLVYPPS